MVAMRVMQVAIHQIVHMVAVRHCFVSAARSMHVASIVTSATMLRRASVGIRIRDLDDMLINMVAMHVMKVSVVQVIHVIAVADGDMATSGSMNVRMTGVLGFRAAGHR